MREQYKPLLPEASALHGAYGEPALGGGAVFFFFFSSVRPARLSDTNADLVGLYTTVRDELELLVEALGPHQERFRSAVAQGNDAMSAARRAGLPEAKAIEARNAPYDAVYYEARRRFNHEEGLSAVERAALMVTLSKSCINGLWRVNRAGKLNAAAGKQYDEDTGALHCPTILDEPNLRVVSESLQHVDIRVCDMVDALDEAERGDFFFVDSPYVPIDDTANFTKYTAGDFTYQDHARLAEGVRRAHARGVRVALANSDVPEARRLYEGFDIRVVRARRSINRDGAKRGAVPEILVRTWI